MNRKIFNGMSKSKFIAAAIGACMLFSVALPAQALTQAWTPTSGGLTQSQISAIISLLQSFGADPSVIANVRAALGGTVFTPMSCVSLTRDLTLGSHDPAPGGTGDVSQLQNYLIAKGYLTGT